MRLRIASCSTSDNPNHQTMSFMLRLFMETEPVQSVISWDPRSPATFGGLTSLDEEYRLPGIAGSFRVSCSPQRFLTRA